MKKSPVLLLGFLIPLLVSLNVSISTPARAAAGVPALPLVISPAAVVDSVPKIAPPKIAVPKVNLVKKIGEFLKFRKNIQAAEQKRIMGVINKTFLKDSVMANSAEIRKLNLALSDTINQRFDSLVSLMNALRMTGGKTDTIFPIAQAGNENDTLVSDSDMSDLVDKILPLIRQKIKQEASEAEGAKKLEILRRFYGRPERPSDTLVVNDRFSLSLTRKAAVYAFYSASGEGSYLNYNFGITGTILYNSYELNGQTGRSKSRNGWATDNVLRTAQQAGCKILLTVSDRIPGDIAAFLQSNRAQQTLTDTVLSLLRLRNANGINIFFQELDRRYRENFVRFVTHISMALKAADPTYEVTVTVPPSDNGMAYDVNELDPFVDKFLINFPDNKPGRTAGAPAPLKGPGNASIESITARYLNANISPSKFILCLPYYGSQWTLSADGKRSRFRSFLTFNDIAEAYHEPAIYDPATAAAFINVENDDGEVTQQIWFDNDQALAEKYDFIVQNRLGGLGICPLASGDGYNNIWPTIADKFLVTDTLYKNDSREERELLRDSLILSRVRKESLGTTWRHVKTYQELPEKVFFLFEHPCANVFTNDSRHKFKFIAEPFRENRIEFYRILRITKVFLGSLNLLCLLLLGLTAWFYIYQLRKKGDRWKNRRLVGGILIGLVNLFVLLAFMYLFLSDAFPGFGANSNKYACYDMPLQTLLLIIGTGVIIGTVVMRYLIFPIIKKEDTP